MGKDSKIEKLKKELDDTKKIMVNNVDKLIIRGQKLEKLKDKTQEIADQSHFLMTDTRKLKYKMYWHNFALTVVIVASAMGGLYGLFSGYSWPGILASGVLTGFLSYGLTKIAAQIQQTYFRLPFVNEGKSLGKEIKILLKKGIFHMKRNKKSALETKLSAAEEEAKLIEQINADLQATKKQEAENQQKLIDRGSKLELLNSDTSKLNTVTENFKTDAKKLERVEEAKNHHYTSILIGFGGLAIGVLYGFLMGYAWPMMMVFGAIGGTFTYGLSSLLTGVEEKVVSIGDSFRPLSWLHLAKAPGSEEKPLLIFEKAQQFLPQFTQEQSMQKEIESRSSAQIEVNSKRKRVNLF
jgi:hypothetical protein